MKKQLNVSSILTSVLYQFISTSYMQLYKTTFNICFSKEMFEALLKRIGLQN
jgi:hypothetical protein